MPRPPAASGTVLAMPGSVYSPNAGRHDALAGDACPLNVGDTWLEPFEGARMQDLLAADHPGLNRYSPTQGIPELIDAIVDKVRERNEVPCERDSVLVCAYATAARRESQRSSTTWPRCSKLASTCTVPARATVTSRQH